MNPISKEDQATLSNIQALYNEQKYAEGCRCTEAFVTSSEFASLDPVLRAEIYYYLACMCAQLDRESEALVFLGIAAGEGYKFLSHMRASPLLSRLQSNPGFLALAAYLEKHSYLNLLVQHATYLPGSPTSEPGFAYQSKEAPALVNFRNSYLLDEVAGHGDDVSRVINLLHWVHAQVRHDGCSSNPEPRNAMNLLEVCRTEGRGINCRMMATILSEACLAQGYPARHITCRPLSETNSECHVITAVWIDSLGKWLYLDPTWGATLSDAEGHLLSVQEVRARLIAGEPVLLSEGANVNSQPKTQDEYLEYMAKNLVILDSPPMSAYGFESWQENHCYIQLQPANIQRSESKYLRITHNEDWFWSKPDAAIPISEPMI